MMVKLIKPGGLGVLLLVWLWLASASAQAATVTVDLCAKDGVLALPGGGSTPIWGFADNTGGGCAGTATLPGPEIRANAGDTVVINLTNALNVPTSIVIPGQLLTPSGGVAGVLTQEVPAAPAGGTVSYTFIAAPGTYLYESGTNSGIQVAMGLHGALIVNSATVGQAYSAPTSAFTNEAVLVLSEIDTALNANPGGFDLQNYKPTYWLINGKGYPNTDLIVAAAGDKLLLRYLSAGFDHYAMALLGAHQFVIAKNSFELTNPFNAVAEAVPAGQTMDAIVSIPAANFSISLYNRNLYVTNNGADPGGMRTVITDNPQPPANLPPSVSAGLDHTVVLPATDALNGTVTDDGLPTPPGAVSTSWSQVSGPGTATFADASAVDTTVSFSAAGVYVLRLTASDGALSTSDDVTITVNAQNQAPTVSAGPDQTITLPAAAALDGTVTDDGQPNPPATVSTSWSKVSGPGTVTFANANAVDTTASFSASGVYVLRLTASDGALSASDEMTIIANAAPSVSAGNDQTITLPAAATLDGTVTDDGLPNPPGAVNTSWSQTSGPGTATFANANAVDTTVSFSAAGTYVLRLTASDGLATTFDEVTIVVNPPLPLIYVSSSSGGTVGGVTFQDEDILVYNPATNAWMLVYDGSLVGAGGVDVDGFDFLTDGSLLLSFDGALATLPGLATGADDSDIVKFTPTTPGNFFAGSYSMFFDASDVGLDIDDEDVDAFGLTPDGRLVVSTLGNFSVPAANGGISGADEDLILFTGTLGAVASGAWQPYFDGSVFGLTAGDEDVWGVALEGGSGKLYLTTRGNFAVTGASGTGADIFTCAATPASLNAPITACTFAPFWVGATYGFGGEIVDALDLGSTGGVVANQAPSVSAGNDQTITLPAAATLDGTVADDGLPNPPGAVSTSWSQTSGPGTATFANANAVDTTVSFSAAGTYVLRLTANDGALSAFGEVTIVVNPTPSSAKVYVSSSSGGTVGGVTFQDEDILVYNPTTNAWTLVYDGSLVGAGGVDVDGFDFQANGSLLLSFDGAVATLPGLATGADDSDIVRFTPTTPGNFFAGAYSMFFDASDVGLDANDEDVDAFGLTPDGRLVVSTAGNFSVPAAAGTVSGADEDLILFTGTLGATASGTWQMYFDGSVFGLTAGSEDVWGVMPEGSSGKLYLTTSGDFAVTGASGTGADIFTCAATPASLNAPITACTFVPFWLGADHGFGGEIVDGLDLDPTVIVAAMVENAEGANGADDDPLNGDVDNSEEGNEETQESIFLPLINR